MTNPSLLLVDDDQENLETYKQSLERSAVGWKVNTARDAKTAMAAVGEHHPDVVICDLCLLPSEEVDSNTEPGGMTVLKQVREDDPFVPVILYTQHDKRMLRYEAFSRVPLTAFQRQPQASYRRRTASQG